MKSTAARRFLCIDPFLLPWLLTVQMHISILMNHLKIHTDTQTATPQRENLCCPLDALEKPRCDECVIARVHLLKG